MTSAFGYSLLSHFPYDLRLHSYIKSPNKLITSLVRGLVPISSNTPNYREFMSQYDLTRFMFSSGSDLVKIFNELADGMDLARYNFSGIAEDLLVRFSARELASIFLTVFG
jgi:hypothetical protein